MHSVSGLVLQTQDNCPPGLLGDWAASRRLPLDVLRVDRWRELPDPSGYAFAVALGSDVSLAGPHPEWVRREVQWIRRADAAGVPVLGICFGAQALAVALGGSVHRLAAPEFAWIELDSHDPGLVPRGPWLALHEDAITAPPDARELSQNGSGLQAFSVGLHVGVQFHPEATRALLSRWLADRRDRGLARVARALRDGVYERGHVTAAAATALFDAFAGRAASLEIRRTAARGRTNAT